MPEDVKKNSQKGKENPKEQRRKRGRHNAPPAEKKIEKEPEPPKEPEKPAFEPPGPEFYKSLKRETDEILKITEEANAKYKKKEIQSNWAKYEMPIETYEEIDEQENLGADYETLIQAPLSVGGHFQFKHEKSWDITTGPSIYDKYFDINMENLNLALSTIPFFERNNIDINIFNESDVQSMNHRATKFKQKYYNDKNFTTPELEAQQKILSSLKSDKVVDIEETDNPHDSNIILNKDINDEKLNQITEIDLGQCEQDALEDSKFTEANPEIEKDIKTQPEPILKDELKEMPKLDNKEVINTKNEAIAGNNKHINIKVVDNDFDEIEKEILDKRKTIESEPQESVQEKEIIVDKQVKEVIKPKTMEPPKVESQIVKEVPKNPVIESPEDLEKWLDDFLDG